jgi:hypothetical protein
LNQEYQETMTSTIVTKEILDEVVDSLKKALADEDIRVLSQRAVQCKVWHLCPKVSAVMQNLRMEEDVVRKKVMVTLSKLVYRFHEFTLDTTLARAGILKDKRIHQGSSLDKKEAFDLFCLDAKERLYLIMDKHGWLQDFFRLYPLHFYENSFQFVSNIPQKKLKVKVKVFGLGIGGSMAASGLAKAGVESVCAYEKRKESGPSSVGSRYQNASWRAYGIAEKLLDEKAYNTLVEYRQRINVQYDDGTTGVITSDRVQIILGSAIDAAIESAKGYGADIHFETGAELFTNGKENTESDIVALFTGAHTSEIFPGLKEEMGIMSWPEINSECKMWIRIKESEKTEFYTARGGESGAENWDYTIESARDSVEDIVRVRNCLTSAYNRNLKKVQKGDDIGVSEADLTTEYEAQRKQLGSVQEAIEKGKTPGGRFDYIFTNAPLNDHNLGKREAACEKDDTVVLKAGYTVEVKMASNAAFKTGKLTEMFNTNVVVCGGDACVPPNPQAAYGATLACEFADQLVQLAVGTGHLNSILEDMKDMSQYVTDDWVQEVNELKGLLVDHYDAKGRAENYFQFVQTLICNLYSLPAFAQ